MSLNDKIFYFFNSLAGKNSFADSLIIFVGDVLPWILIVFTIFYFLFFRKNVKKFTIIVFMIGIASFVTQFLKWQIFLHPRPFVVLPDVVQLINISNFDSFPSGHATIFAALATGIFIYNRRLGIIFAVAAFFIGLARVIAGIHYPLDVLTGFGIGFVMAILSYKLMAYLSKKVKSFVS